MVSRSPRRVRWPWEKCVADGRMGVRNPQSIIYIWENCGENTAHPPTTMSGSTPRKPSSAQTTPNLSETTSTPRTQSELPTLQAEIANQTFQLSSLELARILSLKKLKPGAQAADALLPLRQYDCVVDEQPFTAALEDVVAGFETFNPQPTGTPEKDYYSGLAQFLTGCVKACHDALDKNRTRFPILQERWYKNLEFIVGQTVMDGVGRAAPLKPDITGGNGISAFSEERLYWKPPPDKPTHMITIPVEVKNDWKSMTSQAATYARCLFSANPTITFALVLAFNHGTNALRFLVFHHGGLTASRECNITKRDGLKDAARLFLTLTSWRTPGEAGIITCYNDTTYLLPGDKEGTRHVSAEVNHTLSRYLCIRGRTTFVSSLRLPGTAPRTDPDLPTGRISEPLVDLGGPTLRRSGRLKEKNSTSGHTQDDALPRTSRSRARGSRSITPATPTTALRGESTKENLPAVPEQTDGGFPKLPI